ncbi:MAG: hypothetical protein KatS3mg109_0745 [Pirellulaceae bacterium]|nr:MAG: hypothetical protein KatS3mg109_0745 [Pirellulaceae bacterium]
MLTWTRNLTLVIRGGWAFDKDRLPLWAAWLAEAEPMGAWAWKIGMVAAMVPMVGQARGEQEADSEPWVEKIVASWRAQQESIRTLHARATVESFFSKGYVTSKPRIVSKAVSDYGVIPPDDVWFRGQAQSWTIDFSTGRFRKEFRKARIYEREDLSVPPQITHFHALFLFGDRRFTQVIRPEEWQLPGEPERFRQHVTFDHGPGHAFVILPEDLPLLWCAGGTITGDWPNPMNLRKLDAADRFTLFGNTKWHGHDCVVLRLRNQQSTTSVVEFWVGREPPHAIYRSQTIWFAAGSERVERQIDVEYKAHNGQLLPAEWQVTYFDYYDHSGKPTIHAEKIAVRQIEINMPLSEELFTVRLEPGMGVYDADNNQSFVVDVDGKLVPYQNPEQQRRIAARARQQRTVRIAAPVIGVVALTVAAWFGYRYLRHVRRKN